METGLDSYRDQIELWLKSHWSCQQMRGKTRHADLAESMGSRHAPEIPT